MRTIKVGTRQSQLALAQTKQIVQQLQEKNPQVTFELVPIVTKGDRLVHVSLQEIGGKGVFVKEIQAQLLANKIDLAVHSLKDVPSVLTKGCVLGAIPKRADARDCIIFHQENMTLDTLPKGAVVGTSSLRRRVQLLKIRPDLVIKPLRGNIDTRIKKLASGEYDAIVLALAGLTRIDTVDYTTLPHELLAPQKCLPAVSQGALGLECREDDKELLDILQTVHDEQTAKCTQLEREFLRLMNGDCTFPIGAFATIENEQMYFDVMLASEDRTVVYVKAYQQDEKDIDILLLAKRAQQDLKELGAFGVSLSS